MNIINKTAYTFMKRRYRKVERYMDDPIGVQQRVFEGLIAGGLGTEWGNKYHYGDIRSWEDFSQQVPVNTYADLYPYVQRIMKGENYLLWNEKVRWLAKSSGTTGKASKFIPVTKAALEQCHYKGGKDMVAIYCNMYPDTHLFTGYSLALGGSRQENPDTKLFCGDVSAILMDNLPAWAERFRFPRKEVALMNEWEAKLDALVKSTYNRKIVSLSGVPSWMAVLLQKSIEYAGKNSVAEMWPNIETFFYGGVHFEPYRKKFDQLIGRNDMRYVNIYNASEGFFGVQDQVHSSDMLLLLDNGIFYEFMPLEETDKPNPKLIPLWQVEKGRNYAMVISTNSGLWRYIIGDTVMFTSLSPYRIQITGRTKNFINVCGEELIVDNAIQALNATCAQLDCEVREFTAAPYFSADAKPVGHQWLVEFEREPADIDLFATTLDKNLQVVNTDYQSKRYKDFILRPLLLTVAPQGTFFEWQKQRNRLGGQSKVPRLNNTRETIDPLLEIANSVRSSEFGVRN